MGHRFQQRIAVAPGEPVTDHPRSRPAGFPARQSKRRGALSNRITLVKRVIILALVLLSAGCGKEAGHKGKTVTQWRRDLKHADAEVRRAAAVALAEMGPQARAAVPDLAETLKDQADPVRIQAALALWSMGPEATPAVADLTAALDDRNAEVRADAAGALGAIGPKAVDAVGRLGASLRDENPAVRHAAAKALGAIGPEARGAVSDLIGALRDPDRNVRSEVAYTLAALGPDAQGAVPSLQEMASKETDGQVRGAAVHALSKIQGKK
jgi:HEAT repeat protein